jgi:hypothetical protein
MRNKLLSIIACVIVAFVTIIACEKKKDVFINSAYSEFATPLVSNVKFFVKNDPNSQIRIPLGITTVATTDRKIIIKDSSRTAVNGTQYTLSTTTITIPAGKTVDSVTLNGIYAGYPVGRVDTVYLKIVGGDVPLNAYNTTYSVILQGYCDVIKDDLVGNYTKTIDTYGSGQSAQGAYTATISDWVSTGPTSATIKIKNLGATSDYGFGDVDPHAPGFLPDDPAAIGLNATLDWSNPSSFKVTVPKQTYVLDSYGNGPSTVTATGTFSSCAQTFTITFTVTDPSTTYVPITTKFNK